MKTHNLYLFVGKSGSGKTAITEELCKLYPGTKAVKSVTTRPQRSPDEDSYYFLTDAEYDSANLVQHAHFSGYRYGATMEEVDSSSWFVICPEGVDELKESYFKRQLIVVFLDTSPSIRRERMLKRGDSESAVETRLEHDDTSFGRLDPSIPLIYIDGDKDFDTVLLQVRNAIDHREALCK